MHKGGSEREVRTRPEEPTTTKKSAPVPINPMKRRNSIVTVNVTKSLSSDTLGGNDSTKDEGDFSHGSDGGEGELQLSSSAERHVISVAVSPALSPRNSKCDLKGLNLSIRCGIFSLQGRRKEMEDAHQLSLGTVGDVDSQSAQQEGEEEEESTEEASPCSSLALPEDTAEVEKSFENWDEIASSQEIEDDATLAYLGVFDGHGGKRASDYAAKHLHNYVTSHPAFKTNIVKAIQDGFERTEKEFLHIAGKEKWGDGTTATIAFIVKDTLTVATVGDSEVVLSRAGKGESLVAVHNPKKNEDEIKRVEGEGGVIFSGRVGHPSLNPAFFSLAVSRALGDLMFKDPEYTKGKPSGLIAIPDVRTIKLTVEDQFLILACDGLWDVFGYQEAVDFTMECLKKEDDPNSAAEKLVKEAYEKGSTDNITALVCLLQPL